ncbi:hypothetical protein BT96DRAFT_249369 [Gymnopus androsaceus JB14]|uniref:MARVEL domain-containing protein n=1 Tax=Gymnopus androsaceus JB14 TaxID=1447944 RepID=A0A6A4ISN3_9AGAR|nr:hypothetical protein BT96DRAFT_249369 [Gymnopus androsaceus JB14]
MVPLNRISSRKLFTPKNEFLPPPYYKPLTNRKRRIRHMSTNTRGHFHPFLFCMMTLCAAAELGLTVFLVSSGNADGTWPSRRYHALLIVFAFNSSWTLLFSTAYMLYLFDGAVHFLANVASSVFWLVLTSILWGTAAGFMTRTRSGGACLGCPAISRCRQSLTVEALAWTEFGLCTVNVLATCAWIYTSNNRSKVHPQVPQSEDSRRMI